MMQLAVNKGRIGVVAADKISASVTDDLVQQRAAIVSAISQMGDFYLQNEHELHAYYARLDQGEHPVSRGFRVSHEDKLRRYISYESDL